MQSSPGLEREPGRPVAGAPHPTSGSRPSTAYRSGRAAIAITARLVLSDDGAQALLAPADDHDAAPARGRQPVDLFRLAEGWSVQSVPQPF